MPQVEKHGPCSGPTNRSFLELGGASLCGLGLGTLARATGSKRLLSEDDPAVIFVWLPGGPPHMEMYDMTVSYTHLTLPTMA